jgi:aspartate/methionine/tyrosine aminotransferase
MADEVYERLYYPDSNGKGGVAATAITPSILKKASREDAVIVVQSFSKTYSMTGWRLGWIVARRDLATRAAQMNEFVMSCPAGFTQRAAETALLWGEDIVKQMVGTLRANRDFCAGALAKMPGVTVPKAEGAFYLFPKVEGVKDSFEFCKQILMETQVGLAPGVAFGAGGEGSIRICYAAERKILEEAMARLSLFMKSRS